MNLATIAGIGATEAVVRWTDITLLLWLCLDIADFANQEWI